MKQVAVRIRSLYVSSASIVVRLPDRPGTSVKVTRSSAGVSLITLKAKHQVVEVRTEIGEAKGLRKIKIPATGSPLPSENGEEQIQIDF